MSRLAYSKKALLLLLFEEQSGTNNQMVGKGHVTETDKKRTSTAKKYLPQLKREHLRRENI
ncbi:MAG: hypothetical protein OER80_05755 [Gammaproteobacteria bacterium]|nr:hypothetical protein [Gammaproteobacteria bacterium]